MSLLKRNTQVCVQPPSQAMKKKQLSVVTGEAPSLIVMDRSPNQRKKTSNTVAIKEEDVKKNRKIIKGCLRHVGKLVNRKLRLSPQGICYFQYKKFVIVVEVPDDKEDSFLIYTMVLRLLENNTCTARVILKKCMELNYMQLQTNGSTLGLDDNGGDEINLCYTGSINTAARRRRRQDEFVQALEGFLMTAEQVNQELERIK